ncbi:MAG: cysteine hydrolase, partial [Caballeronia sp.]
MSHESHAGQVNPHPYADPVNPALPPSDFKLDVSRAALVVVDPQNDFLSP